MSVAKGRLFLGLSGWNYADWKDGFYAGVPRRLWLEHYAEHFAAVEVNATFYRRQKPTTFEAWAARTPPGFTFTLKGHKWATHYKRLLEPEQTVPHLGEAAEILGPRLGALLWQLPGNFKADLPRLDRFCAVLRAEYPRIPQIMELRHETWFTDETAALLAAHGVSHCMSDAADWPLWHAVTASPVYIRLHGHDETYVSSYAGAYLADLAERIRAWLANGQDVHVYFDNTAAGAAPRDAARLAGLLAKNR